MTRRDKAWPYCIPRDTVWVFERCAGFRARLHLSNSLKPQVFYTNDTRASHRVLTTSSLGRSSVPPQRIVEVGYSPALPLVGLQGKACGQRGGNRDGNERDSGITMWSPWGNLGRPSGNGLARPTETRRETGLETGPRTRGRGHCGGNRPQQPRRSVAPGGWRLGEARKDQECEREEVSTRGRR